MIRGLAPLLTGFAIWALAFVALYALQALGCAWGWPAGAHRTALVCLWLATLGSLVMLLLAQKKRPGDADRPMHREGLTITLVATAATMVTYFPVTFITLCL